MAQDMEDAVMSQNVKQVIVMRTDLNMRKGKMVAQGAHASIAFLRELVLYDDFMSGIPSQVFRWLEGGMTKICVRVDSEEELLAIEEKAKLAGLLVHLIVDAGHTEFDGPTRTCLAIGPASAELIDEITGELKLL